MHKKFDETIRSGEITSVRNQIELLIPSAIPRKLVAAFADIARRVRSELWGLRLMRPIVRSETPVFPKPTELELCTYAGLLIKVGALPEAKQKLLQLDRKNLANVDIFLGEIHIAQWNYKDAVPHYKKILARKDLSDYVHAIAQVNFASALIFLESYTAAEKILPKLLQHCQDHKWELLYANTLEISAQLAVWQSNWNEVHRLLTEAEQVAGPNSHYRLYIDKWRALAGLFKARTEMGSSDNEELKIVQIRQQALSLKSWETVRDLDFYLALYQKNVNVLLNVYFGTPHPAYKNRIKKLFKKKGWLIPKSYFRKLTSDSTDRLLDLETAQEVGRAMIEPIKPGQMLHRLLNILATDFYKPIAIGELFSKLYPDEYFNPDIAPGRVAQAVKLLRRWIEANQIPLMINVDNNRYSIAATAPYAFKITSTVQSASELQNAGFKTQLKRLSEKWPYQSFSALQASQFLEISASSARKLLAKALSQQRIYTSGTGRSTQYRFQK